MKLLTRFPLVRLQLLLVLLTTCPYSLGRPQEARSGYTPVCIDYDYGYQHGVEQICLDSTFFCGVDPTNGKPAGCITDDQCTPTTSSYKLECPNSDYCCCKMSAGDSGRLPCNDVLNTGNDAIWKQACTLEALRDKDFCRHSPVTTTPPPATARQAKDFPQKCMDFCRQRAQEQGIAGFAFEYKCGKKGYYDNKPYTCTRYESPEYNCPEECDGYCSEDTTMLQCPSWEVPTTKSPYAFHINTPDLIAAFILGTFLFIIVVGFVLDYFDRQKRKRRGVGIAAEQQTPMASGEGAAQDGSGTPQNPDLQQQPPMENQRAPPSANPSQNK